MPTRAMIKIPMLMERVMPTVRIKISPTMVNM
jgi:hypothetical protein